MQIAILSQKPAAELSVLAQTIQLAEMEVFDFSWNEPLEKLYSADAYVLLSDFVSYAPSSAEQLVPALTILLKTQNAKGKPVLGLGPSASRVLVDSGLIPGLFKNLVGVTLREDTSANSEQTETLIRLSEDYQYNAFTRCLKPQQLLTVLHTGKSVFVIPPGLLLEMEVQGLNVFLYCDAEGKPLSGNRNIAALSNKAGTVMAMLPQPEHFPLAEAIFKSLRAHLLSGYVPELEPLYYWPRK